MSPPTMPAQQATTSSKRGASTSSTTHPPAASASPTARVTAATPPSVAPPGGSGISAMRRGPGSGVAKGTGCADGSRRWGPASAWSATRTSATVRAIGPSTANSWVTTPSSANGMVDAAGTRPVVGLIDAIEQHVAGLRSDPPRSLPNPIGVMPVANAAPSPPELPPAVWSGCQGLRVSPCKSLSVLIRSPRSGRLVRASGTAPAAFMRSTTGASTVAAASASACKPCVVAWPATSMFSLIVNGTPASGPRGSPAARAASIAAAAASEISGIVRVTALTVGLTASMRSRWAWTSSTELTSPDFTAAACSVALNSHGSVIAESPRGQTSKSIETVLVVGVDWHVRT